MALRNSVVVYGKGGDPFLPFIGFSSLWNHTTRMVQVYRPPGWGQHDAHSPGWQTLWLLLLSLKKKKIKINLLCSLSVHFQAVLRHFVIYFPVSDSRLRKSPWQVPGIHQSRGRTQKCCNQCHSHSCSRCWRGLRWRSGSIYCMDNRYLSANVHRYQAAL